MITPELRPPAMETMDVLEGEDILVHHDGGKFRIMMMQLGMRCYVDPRGYYWIGVWDPTFPAHDRWAFVLDAAQVAEKRSWVAAEFYDVEGGQPTPPDKLGSQLDLPMTMEIVHELIDEVLRHAGQDTLDNDPTGTRRQDLLMRMVQIWTTLGIGAEATAYEKLLRVPWGQDMHDLIHHTESWVARNPEFVGMPRDLLLRMHGFDDTTLSWLDVACVL